MLFKPNSPATIYAGAYFAGAKPLRSLVPQFSGNVYLNDTLPDYTFGGILQNQPAYKTESFFRKEFYSYAGIYSGSVYDLTYGDPSAGSVSVYVSTNQHVVVVGYDIDSANNISDGQSSGIGAQFTLDPNGNWSFQSNSVSGFGSIGKDGSFDGELDFTNGDSVQISGNQLPPLGSFQNSAGYYTGNYSGGNSSGTLQGVLDSSGYLTVSYTHLFNFMRRTITMLNPRKISLVLAVQMIFSAAAIVRAQPVITLQPTNLTVLSGGTATFTVAVSGTGPFTYQWLFNSNNLPNSIITTVAGSGTNNYSGDGAAATNATLASPSGVAVDAVSNLFIADSANNRVRKVGTNGVITTVAGNGSGGYSGDNGAATNASLYYPVGVAVDATGNLFIADSLNYRIRKVATNGIITTVAGDGSGGYGGDNAAATAASLYAGGVTVCLLYTSVITPTLS